MAIAFLVAMLVAMLGLNTPVAIAADPNASLVGSEDAVRNNQLVEGGEPYHFQLGMNDSVRYSVEASTVDTHQCTISKDGSNFGAVFTTSDKVRDSRKPTKMMFDTWVRAVDDSEPDGSKNCRITYKISSSNAYYDGLVFPVDLAVADNDSAATAGSGIQATAANGYIVDLLINGMKADLFEMAQLYEKDFITITGRTLPNATVHLYFSSDSETKAFVQADQSGKWQYIASSLGVGKHKLDAQVKEDVSKVEGKRQTLATFTVLAGSAKATSSPVNQKNYTVVALIAAISLISLALVISLVVFLRHRRVIATLKTDLNSKFPAPAQVDPAAYAAYVQQRGGVPSYPNQPAQPQQIHPNAQVADPNERQNQQLPGQ